MGERGTSQRFEHICLEAGIEKHERIILSILLMNMRGAYHYHGLTISVHLCSGFLAKLSCLRQGRTADTLPGARRPGWVIWLESLYRICITNDHSKQDREDP